SYDTCRDGMAIATSDDVFGTAIQETLQAPGRNLLVRNCIPATLFLTIPSSKASYAEEADALLAPTVQKDGNPTRCLFLAVQTDVAGELLNALKAREATVARPPYSAFIGSSTLNVETFFDQAKSPVIGEPSRAEGFYGFDADANPRRTQL